MKGLVSPQYNIEIKSAQEDDQVSHPAPDEFVDLVVKVCNDKKLGKRLTIQSFDVRPLQVLHKKYPEIKLSYLIGNTKSPEDNLAVLGFKPNVYSPHYKTVTPQVVSSCHEKGILIIPWTVNTKEEINQLIQLKVDGIITDYPNLF